MSVPSGSNIIIYRYTNAGDNYTNPNFGDFVALNFGAIPTPLPPSPQTYSNPDKTGHETYEHYEAEISLQENPQPNVNVPHNIQDLGLSRFTAEIHGVCEYPPNTTVPLVILGWLQQFRTNSVYPFGRFGITSVDFPQFQGKPSSTSGYVLAYAKVARVADFPKLDVILRLQWNGPPTNLGIPGP